jgi:hypothetical protein
MVVKQIEKVVLLVLALIVALGAYSAYRMRLQIATRFWHWRYGSTTLLENYEIPVPTDWLPQTLDDTTMYLVDTRRSPKQGPLSEVGMITISIIPSPLKDIALWRSNQIQFFGQHGVEDTQEISIQAGDERISCIGGHLLGRIVPGGGITAVSFQCVSTGRLSVGYGGPQAGLSQFQAIVSEIHQR